MRSGNRDTLRFVLARRRRLLIGLFMAACCLLVACSVPSRHASRIPPSAAAGAAAGASSGKPVNGLDLARGFDSQDAWQIVKPLADPSFQGRHVGTPGEMKGAQYVAGLFAKAGLKPGGDNGTYIQTFPLQIEEQASTPVLALTGANGQTDNLRLRDDFRPIYGGIAGGGDVQGPGLFVGSNADMAQLGVKGKILFLSPGGTFRDLVTQAQDAGALAIIVPTGEMTLLKGEGRAPDTNSIPVDEISQSGATALLEGSGHTRDELNGDVQSKQATPSFPLAWTIHLSVSLKPPATVDVHNVLGILPGKNSDTHVIVVGAHYEEIGPDPDGVVYPAANDNASGTAVVLELARLLHQAGFQPNDTIVFAAWSGHEEGLFGSQFYSKHALFPLTSTVLYLNIDTVGQGSGSSLDAVSTDTAVRSEMTSALQGYADENKALPVNVSGNSEGLSDDSTFSHAGVPSIALNWSGLGPVSKLHTPQDDAQNVDPAKLAVAGETASLMLAQAGS